jgi:multicomponent Na+:H+ antiporter subunit A
MLLALSSILILTLAAPWLGRLRPRLAGWICALVPLGLTGYFLAQLGQVSGGRTIVEYHSWAPALGVSFSLYLDGLSLLFALLITGVGAPIFIYAGRYLGDNPQSGRFYLWFSGFMGAMLGLVLAGNLITLFVFWELTSISSYFLIAFEHRRESARSAALQALLVTSLGGLALLAGFLLMGMAGGSLEITELLNRGEAVRSHALHLPILLLVLAAAFTKSAQIPFHFWLPSAMEAPTPVSAYLHSVTMVKAGVYLLARLSPVMGGTDAWILIVTTVGGLTMVAGAVLALFQSDMKRLLAYSTVNALGTMIFLLGIGTEKAVKAALVYILVHSLYKGALFQVAGVVDHETGSREVRAPRQLARQMPLIAAAAALAALSMAGMPPFFGYIGKESIYTAALEAPFSEALLLAAAAAANIVLFATAALVFLRPFFGRSGEKPDRRPVSIELLLGPLVLAGFGLIIGIFPSLVDEPLIAPGVESVLGRPAEAHLALWHGVNMEFLLSLFTIAGGGLLYLGLGTAEKLIPWGKRMAAFGPSRWYRWALKGLDRLARGQTRFLQHGHLNIYILTLLMTTAAFAFYSLFRSGEVDLLPQGLLFPQASEAMVALLVVASALLSTVSPSRLSAIVAMGGVGFGVALIYLEFGAPDLAMTQFAVETVTVILFVLVIHHLPRYTRLSTRSEHLRDLLAATVAGSLMTLLVLAALALPEGDRLSDFFAHRAWPEAHGRNIVNVILVDFRALDTLGEISVLALAALGVFVLLKFPGKRGRIR